MQSVMPKPVSAIVEMLGELGEEPAVESSSPPDLRWVWGLIPDPRDRRGRRHGLVAVLSLVQAAVVAGSVSWAAICHWVGKAEQPVLEQIGAWRQPRTGHYVAPHPDTMHDLLESLDMGAVDAAYAAYRAAQLPVGFQNGA